MISRQVRMPYTGAPKCRSNVHLRPNHRPYSIKLKLSPEEIARALNVEKRPYCWDTRDRIQVLSSLDSREETVARQRSKIVPYRNPITQAPKFRPTLTQALEHHKTKYGNANQGAFANIPVFSFFDDLPEWRYEGSLSELQNVEAREAIINGHYRFIRDGEYLSGNQLVVTDGTNKLDDFRLQGTKDLFEETLLQEALKRAISSDGISQDDLYADTMVYDFEEGGKEIFKLTGDLRALPEMTKLLIKIGHYTIIRKHGWKKHFSSNIYRGVAAVVTGIKDLDPRDLGNQTFHWTISNRRLGKTNNPRPKAVPVSSEVSKVPPKKLALSLEEISSSFEARDRDTLPLAVTKDVFFRVLANLSMGNWKNPQEIETDQPRLSNIISEGWYLERSIRNYSKILSTQFADSPVFKVDDHPKDKNDVLFTFGGSLSQLFSATAKERILNGNYQFYSFALDMTWSEQLSLILAYPENFFKTHWRSEDYSKLLIKKILTEKIKLAMCGGLGKNDLYADTLIYTQIKNPNVRGPFLEEAGELWNLSKDFKDEIQRENYTIMPLATSSYSRKAFAPLNKKYSVIALVKDAREGDLYYEPDTYY